MCAANSDAGDAGPPRRLGAQARLRALQAGIIELILERELEPGDPLPTENELAALLGIGRNTLRETLKVLQALGVIEIRHGFGMFVAASNFEAPTPSAHNASPPTRKRVVRMTRQVITPADPAHDAA